MTSKANDVDIAVNWEDYERKTADAVNHPGHYNRGSIEVIDFIEDQRLGFSLGNAVKYVARAGAKGDAVEDLKKAAWYIQREISRLENERKGNG